MNSHQRRVDRRRLLQYEYRAGVPSTFGNRCPLCCARMRLTNRFKNNAYFTCWVCRCGVIVTGVITGKMQAFIPRAEVTEIMAAKLNGDLVGKVEVGGKL